MPAITECNTAMARPRTGSGSRYPRKSSPVAAAVTSVVARHAHLCGGFPVTGRRPSCAGHGIEYPDGYGLANHPFTGVETDGREAETP